MTEEQKLTMLERLTGEKDTDLLRTYLDIAGQEVIRKAYPFRDDVKDVPKKYSINQVKIAQYLFNKRGAEGETYHSENGINRSYENADVPVSMLKNIIPVVGVI